MPVDQKRINGPENSFSYHLYSQLNSETYENKLKHLINAEGIRKDGRKLNETRKIC